LFEEDAMQKEEQQVVGLLPARCGLTSNGRRILPGGC
jgi:hypothetical protein